VEFLVSFSNGDARTILSESVKVLYLNFLLPRCGGLERKFLVEFSHTKNLHSACNHNFDKKNEYDLITRPSVSTRLSRTIDTF
jgi:hypothetical protein